jgi:hypothetical protein
MGPVWTPVTQALHNHKQAVKGLAGQAQQGNLYDQFTNCVEVAGSNLAQQVVIGASFGVGGVTVATGLANGTAGRASAQNVCTGTITLNKGSYNATLDGSPSGTFAAGMVIGAVDADGNGVISPGTTITAASGSAVTLSEYPLETGTALYCAACNFVRTEAGAWSTLTVPPGFSLLSTYYSPAARLLTGDTVELRGIMQNTSGSAKSGTLLELPTVMQPTSSIYFPGGVLTVTSGWISAPLSGIAAGGYAALDSLRFSLF